MARPADGRLWVADVPDVESWSEKDIFLPFSKPAGKKNHLDSSVDSLRVIRLVFAIYFEWMDIVDVYRHFFSGDMKRFVPLPAKGFCGNFSASNGSLPFAADPLCISWVCIWGCRHPANFNQSPTLVYFFIDKV